MILVISPDASLAGAVAAKLDFMTPVWPLGSGLELLREMEPDLVLCDVHGDGPEDVDACRPIVEAAGARSIPLLVVTSWRDLLFTRGHFLASAPGRRSVVFRPLDDSYWIEEARRLLEQCDNSCPV